VSQIFTCGLSDLLLLAVGSLVVFVLREYILKVHILFNGTVALFTKILTIKNCRKRKTKIKKSFTKILTIILSVKIVLTLRVKLPCPKCRILIVREILVFIFYRK
jgi:hypothetical protein